MDFLRQHLEALIFCANEPVTLDEMERCLSEMFDTEIPYEHIEQALVHIEARYQDEEHVFSLVKIGGGYQFLTKPAYQASISLLLKQKARRKLSTSALETLAIIAYKQPITKTQVEAIRGVNCDYAVQKLLEKELIEIAGKSEAPGRPILYGTSRKFMDYFGLNSLKDLPQPKDFASEENSIGLPAEAAELLAPNLDDEPEVSEESVGE